MHVNIVYQLHFFNMKNSVFIQVFISNIDMM